MGHFAWDCPKPRENANIARENKQNRKLAEMMDLGNNSVCEECAMICMDMYSDDEDEEIIVYRDQGIRWRNYEEDMYGELMNTDSDEEKIINYNMALCAQDSGLMEKKLRRLNWDIPSENVHNISQRHNEINENDREMAINKETNTVQGPISNDEETESQKARTMEILLMDGNISTTEADEQEQIEESNKKSLYARAMHSNHMMQHHMEQSLECQGVVDEYRSMADGEREMISLELDQYKNDPMINQHIMQMIETDIFWYKKTFRAILMELWKIQNGETIAQTSEEHSEKEIYCCDESHVMLNDPRLYKGEKAQQDGNNTKSVNVSSKAQKNWPRKRFQINENNSDESAMMCWENLEDSEQEPKTKKMIGRDEETNDDKEKQNDEMDNKEHIVSTVYTGNRLKIPVEKPKLGVDDDTSTLAAQETSVKKLVYITNIQAERQGIVKDACNDGMNPSEKDDKKPTAKTSPLKKSPL